MTVLRDVVGIAIVGVILYLAIKNFDKLKTWVCANTGVGCNTYVAPPGVTPEQVTQANSILDLIQKIGLLTPLGQIGNQLIPDTIVPSSPGSTVQDKPDLCKCPMNRCISKISPSSVPGKVTIDWVDKTTGLPKYSDDYNASWVALYEGAGSDCLLPSYQNLLPTAGSSSPSATDVTPSPAQTYNAPVTVPNIVTTPVPVIPGGSSAGTVTDYYSGTAQQAYNNAIAIQQAHVVSPITTITPDIIQRLDTDAIRLPQGTVIDVYLNPEKTLALDIESYRWNLLQYMPSSNYPDKWYDYASAGGGSWSSAAFSNPTLVSALRGAGLI